MAPPAPVDQLPRPNRDKPLLTKDDAQIIFILGGPGSGKGTQSDKLVNEFGFKHLSAGDLLREEQQREGSQFGDLIKYYLKEGLIVPMEITVQLLENKIVESIKEEGARQFLIDGFPRKLDQARFFEETVCPSTLTIFFDCPEEVMQERLLNRGKTSGRSDDNIESIKKRFRTFIQDSYPVVVKYEKEGKPVVRISAVPPPDEVYEVVKEKLKEAGIKMPNGNVKE